MEVRANKVNLYGWTRKRNPKRAFMLLFEWHPEQKTIDLIRKDKFYRIRLEEHAYRITEERSKYEGHPTRTKTL